MVAVLEKENAEKNVAKKKNNSHIEYIKEE